MNLFAAKLRSLLAILGILVGTGSVVALISSSQLATEHALSQFKKLGTNLLAVTISSNQGNVSRREEPNSSLNVDDIPLIKSQIPAIEKIVPYTTLFQALRFQDIEFNGQILGATEALADIVKIKIAEGRFVSFLIWMHSFYCVIGAGIGQKIREKGFEPINQQISVGKNLFTIIGVAEKWEPNLFLFSDVNEGIIIPIGFLL